MNGRASSGLLTAHTVPCACCCRLCGCIAEVEADAQELLLPHGELARAPALREHYLLRTDDAEALVQVGLQVVAGLSRAAAAAHSGRVMAWFLIAGLKCINHAVPWHL